MSFKISKTGLKRVNQSKTCDEMWISVKNGRLNLNISHKQAMKRENLSKTGHETYVSEFFTEVCLFWFSIKIFVYF